MTPRSLRHRADRRTDATAATDEHLVTVVVDLDVAAGDHVQEVGAELALGTRETNAELLRHHDGPVDLDVTGTIQHDGTLTVIAALHLQVPTTAEGAGTADGAEAADGAEVDAWSSAVQPDEVASFRLEASGPVGGVVARGAILHHLPESQQGAAPRASDPAS